MLRVRSKGSKVVLVPLPPPSGGRSTALSEAGYQVRSCSTGGEPGWTGMPPTRRLRNLACAAGVRIGRTHPHMLRHTFVTTMLDAGVDLRDVQIAARHADPRTTMRLRPGPQQPRPASELHPGRLHGLGHIAGCPAGSGPRLPIASDAYTMGCMPGLYAVEVEPEVRSWLERLSDRDFGRADFLVGLLAEQAEPSASPTRVTSAGKCANCGSTCWPSSPHHLLARTRPPDHPADGVPQDPDAECRSSQGITSPEDL